jgi:Ca2+-binding EF-hand superfamily protein
MGALADYIEDNLDIYIHDDDVTSVFNTIDKDGDNKISFDDFVAFLETGNNWSKSCKSLRLINPFSIVDVQISTSPARESDLSSQRYIKVISSTGASDENGTFGKGVSLWYLRCKDGTGNGRLKPVIDIQLSSTAASSSFVLQQYVRLEQPIRGNYIWIKRDDDNDKDEDLVDICVTRGKSKSKTDLIWTPPGLYWERVDGNFTPEFFGGVDTFLWLRPQIEINDRNVVTKVRFKLDIFENQKLILQRNSALVETVRQILRNYTPIEFVKDDLFTNDVYSYSSTKNATETTKSFDHEALFYQFDPKRKRNLSEKRFLELLRKVGVWLDYDDMKRVFSYFHVNVKNKNKSTDFVLFDFIFSKRISLNEFTEMITLNDHGINKTLDIVKQYIFLSAEYNAKLIDPDDFDSLLKTGSSLKQRKFLHLVFRRYDLDGDGYLTKGFLLFHYHHHQLIIINTR